MREREKQTAHWAGRLVLQLNPRIPGLWPRAKGRYLTNLATQAPLFLPPSPLFFFHSLPSCLPLFLFLLSPLLCNNCMLLLSRLTCVHLTWISEHGYTYWLYMLVIYVDNLPEVTFCLIRMLKESLVLTLIGVDNHSLGELLRWYCPSWLLGFVCFRF